MTKTKINFLPFQIAFDKIERRFVLARKRVVANVTLISWQGRRTWCFFSLIWCSQPSATNLRSGQTRTSLIFQEARLDLTYKRPSCQPTGTHPFPRSASVWRSAIRWSSLSLTGMPILCTHWSLTGITEPPHWAVTRGRRCLVQWPRYNSTVTWKGSMLHVPI